MICELFPFQQQAVNEMRLRVAMALNNYRMLKIPQVVSLQAPTGSGKTITKVSDPGPAKCVSRVQGHAAEGLE